MKNSIICDDCLSVSRKLPANSVDLIYLDPPFFSQRSHRLTNAERTESFEFSDKWSSRTAYLVFLKERLLEFRRILSATGSLFFHCDTSASHHIRCLLDEIFGEDMFRSEIIWNYRRWANAQRAPLPSHQTIFFYTKAHSYKYNPIFLEYSHSTNVDQILQRRSRDQHSKAAYARDDNGNVVVDGHKQGVPISDVWDIPFLNPKAKERVGYPTQKPILLLERIISLCTDKGDTIFDPFCGSGTTLVAASLLQREYLGVDVSADAVRLTKERLENPVKTHSRLLTFGRESYETSDKDALMHIFGLPVIAVQRNLGIDALLSAGPGQGPILIRVQRSDELLSDAASKLLKASAGKRPSKMIVVATRNSDSLFEDRVDHEGITVVNSTANEILSMIKVWG